MNTRFKLAAVALAAALSSAAFATGNSSAPSDWRFTPGQLFNGVSVLDAAARLSFTTPAGGYACSGTLLQGGQYVLTAAHCADDYSSMTVNFQFAGGVAGVTRTVAVGDATIHPLWTGVWNNDADRGIDLAILKLSSPVTTIQGLALSNTNDMGKTMLVAGYGTTSNGGSGVSPGWNDSAYGHYGYNVADVDSKTFNQVADQYVPGWGYSASYYAGTTYMFDFDNPNGTGNNTLGLIASATGNQWASGAGLGANEAIIAGGDSGGGDYVWTGSQWVLSGVHSWGWQGGGADGACTPFGLTGCDISATAASSYGDLSGSTAVFDQLAWINGVTGVVAVPEPGTYALMLAGVLGLAGATRRRKAV